MKFFVRNIAAVLAVTLAATAVSFGQPPAPEIDSTMGTAALALLGGAIVVIRGRRR